jgi:hypothetical protein
MHSDPCFDQNIGRRKVFWTTRPAVCGDYVVCGVVCPIPGLEYEDVPEDVAPVPPEPPQRTIKTDGWLNSLILNILNTRARTDMKCPAPAAVFGHWSESYRDDNLYIGSTLWNAADKPYRNTADMVKRIGNAVKADLSKLVALQVAIDVDVDAKDGGSGRVNIVATVTTSIGQSRINLAGGYVSETWIWQ